MRISTEPRWRKRFALFPVAISAPAGVPPIYVWLERYWSLEQWKGYRAIATRVLEDPPPRPRICAQWGCPSTATDGGLYCQEHGRQRA